MAEKETGRMHEKWNHFFDLIDTDGNGVLEVDDFVIIAQRLGHLFHKRGKKVDQKTLKWQGRELFDRLKAEMGISDSDSIDKESWIKWLNDITFNGKESTVYRSFTIAICREIFNVVDQNNDGFISRPEFNEFYLVFNIPNPVSSHVFYLLDRNQDGIINKIELLEGIRHFFIGTEPSDYDIIFGEI